MTAQRKCGKCQQVFTPDEKTQLGLCHGCNKDLDEWESGRRPVLKQPVEEGARRRRDRSRENGRET